MGKFPEMHENTSCLVCKRMENSRQRPRPPGHPPGHPDTRTCGHPATNDTPDTATARPRPRPRPRPGHGHGHAHGHGHEKKQPSAAAEVQCRARSKHKNAQRQVHGCNWFGYADGSTALASGTGKSRRPAQLQRLENGHRSQKASIT